MDYSMGVMMYKKILVLISIIAVIEIQSSQESPKYSYSQLHEDSAGITCSVPGKIAPTMTTASETPNIPPTWSIAKLYASYSPKNSSVFLSTTNSPKTKFEVPRTPFVSPTIYVYSRVDSYKNSEEISSSELLKFIEGCKLRAAHLAAQRQARIDRYQ